MHIDNIELYFQTFGLPSSDIEVNQGVFVLCHNAELFVAKTIACLRAHPGNDSFNSYYDLLLKYYEICKTINDAENI